MVQYEEGGWGDVTAQKPEQGVLWHWNSQKSGGEVSTSQWQNQELEP